MRKTLPAFAGTLCFVAVTSSAYAATVHELLEQGDRLTQTDEGFPEAFLHAVSLYEQAAMLDQQNPLPHVRMARTCLALGDWL